MWRKVVWIGGVLAAITALLASSAHPAWAVPSAAPAACSDLFISEYVEGSSNNKAIEIYNGTGTAVNLSGYSLAVYANGSASATSTINLSGSLADGDVYVVVNSGASTSLLDLANLTSGSLSHNGDDAVALQQGATLIDVIGQIGFDPGTEWGSGLTSTADNTLRRKSTVGVGDGNDGDAFDPSVQWDGYAVDTFDGLGAHTASCSSSGDAAPAVSSTTPANNAPGVAVASDIIINFSENVDVSAGWYTISCTSSGAHTAVVSGGPQTFTLNPDADFVTNETCTVSLTAANITDQDIIDPPDTLAANYTWSFTTVGAPTPCSTIPLIQGTGTASTCTTVSNIQGCIIGIGATGFYMQDISGDGNVNTSDGIYVYRGGTWTNPSNWQAGDLVRVSGSIIEYYNTTEFQAGNSVTRLGSCTMPAPVSVSPIADPTVTLDSLYERYEGMRVQMSFDGWVVGPTKRYASRFAVEDPEIAFVDFSSTIPDYARVFHDTYPGYQGLNYLGGGLNVDLPDLDAGDRLSGVNVTGVLAYTFDKFSLLVDSAPSLTITDRPDVTNDQTALDPLKREFDICFANVENLFDVTNDGAGDWGDWVPGWPSPTAADYQAKLNHVATALINGPKSCMVYGLEEMEGKQQVYNDLAAALHTIDPAHTWTAAYAESGDSRDISQGFLWRSDVTLVGSVTPVSGAPYTTWVSDGALNFVRTPPTGVFRFWAGTATQIDVRLYAMHFKSKGSSASCSVPDCTDVREREAADLRDILLHHQTAGEYAIAGGDFNDYLNSTPIGMLDAATGLHNVYTELPAEARYSYIFSGESEVLDHIFMTDNLLAVNGAHWSHTFSPVHVNTDFPAREHASDHDPLRLRFSFYVDDGAGSPGADLSDLPLTYDLAWHTGPHSVYLGSGVTDDAIYANGADDASDDGVTRVAGYWQPGNTVTLDVQSSATGYLIGWIDWNDDGELADPGEQAIDQAVVAGANSINVVVPAAAAVGRGSNVDLAARFRVYDSLPADMLPTGHAIGGEVEDYVWDFGPLAITLNDFNARSSANPIGWGWPIGLLLIAGGVVWRRVNRQQTSR